VALWPSAIVVDPGWEGIVGGAQVTVTVATELSKLPQAFDTLAQYELVVVGETVRLWPVPPSTGDAVFTALPTYHWYAKGAVPLAVTLRVVFWPSGIVDDVGWEVIVGAVQVTVTVAVALSIV